MAGTKTKPGTRRKPRSVRKALTTRANLPVGHFHLDEKTDVITIVQMAKYRLFVTGVITHGNLTQASIDAGMLAPTRHAQAQLAQRLMAIPVVGQMLRTHYEHALVRAGITEDRVYAELAHLAFSDIGDCIDDAGVRNIGDIPESARRAIQSYKIKRTVGGSEENPSTTEEREVKMAPKDPAIDKLCRLLNMIQENKNLVVTPEALLAAMEEGRRRALEQRA